MNVTVDADLKSFVTTIYESLDGCGEREVIATRKENVVLPTGKSVWRMMTVEILCANQKDSSEIIVDRQLGERGAIVDPAAHLCFETHDPVDTVVGKMAMAALLWRCKDIRCNAEVWKWFKVHQCFYCQEKPFLYVEHVNKSVCIIC